jgi:hypothetical protein
MGRPAKGRKTATRPGRPLRKPRPLREPDAPVDYALSASQFSTLRAAKPPATIPAWWVNTAIGVFLLPLAGIWTQTFFTCFSRATLHQGFWASAEFWFFSLGALLWTIAFFGLPRPLLLYVFGHELTHALWVWVMGGRVSQFKVRRDGGHIVTNMNNFWVALSPYFFPIYSIAVILLFGGIGLFHDMSRYRELLFGLIGATWAFHISFTLWMIPKGQSDLSYHGTFFSLVVIYLMNLLILTVMLLIASPHTSWHFFGHEMLRNTTGFSRWIAAEVRAARGS